jgi:hypothetical protein
MRGSQDPRKGRGSVNDAFITKLSELTFERLQWTEIVEVERVALELARDVVGGASGRTSIDDLKDALVAIKKAQSGKVEQKLRIYQPEKQVEIWQ